MTNADLPAPTVAAAFAAYRHVLPPVQTPEVERAFYAGAYATLVALDLATLTPEARARVAALRQECEAFLCTPAVGPHPLDQGAFNIRHDDAERFMRSFASEMKLRMKLELPGFGFAVLIFSFGPGGAMFYASSAQRSDMIAAMKEFIQRNTQ